jgi:hypothetical protein
MKTTCLIALSLGATLMVATAAAGKAGSGNNDVGAIVNGHLRSAAAGFRLATAECLGAPGFQGATIYFNDRGSKKLESHFVPGDPRRGGFTDLTWITEGATATTANALTPAQTSAAIGRAMATWDGVQCSTIPLTSLGSSERDLGYVQYLLGFGGSPGWAADITHAGWLPGEFFDALEPDGSDSILGVTFTFTWVNKITGEATDIDHNGKSDVAFRETYYNNAFPWGIGTDWPVDVESVALHEAGHGLSQAHFGELFRTPSNGRFHFAPQAVMNAGYMVLQQKLRATDVAGHCSVWAPWPNR